MDNFYENFLKNIDGLSIIINVLNHKYYFSEILLYQEKDWTQT